MEEIERALQEEMELLMQELIQSYDDKGMRSSGRWANSLRVEVQGTVGRITGFDYARQLEYGRRGGTMPPVEQIEQWIQDKGIQPIESSLSINNFAWAIALKIQRQGWDRRGFGGTALVSEVVTPARVTAAFERIGAVNAAALALELTEVLNTTLDA